MTLFSEYFSVPKSKAMFIASMVSSMVTTAINAHMVWVVSRIVDAILNGESWQIYLGVLIADETVFALSQFIQQIYRRRITQHSYTVLSNRVMDKVLAVDYDTFTSSGEGRMHKVLESVSDVANSGKALLGVINAIISLGVILFAIGKIYLPMILPILGIYGICIYPIWKLNRRIGKCDSVVTSAKSKRSNTIQRVVSGFAELRALSMQNYHRKEFQSLNREVYDAIDDKVNSIAQYVLILNVIDLVISAAVVLFAVQAIPTGLSPTLVMTLTFYGWELMNPMTAAIDCLDEFSTRKAEFRVYKEFMETPIRTKDGFINLSRFTSSIEFDRVDFAYDNSDDVLKNVSFRVEKGEKIGIVGQSGCGKTTLLKLLERFYDPTMGHIYIDGIDIDCIKLNNLRSKIGYIQQDPYIFKGSILENICYGASGRYTDAEIVTACKRAAIYDFIMGLPEKFGTEVGPDGLKLSGGQKQRLALARVFLRNPPIILLDEATSALDNESENIVQEALNSMRGKTVIAIAHRLTTVKDFDRILVFDEHRLVEEGTHNELIGRGGVYSRLWFSKEKLG